FSRDGAMLAASSDFKDRSRDSVELLDLATGQARGTLKGEKSVVDWVALSPRGAVAAPGRSDRLVRLWDTTTGTLTSVLKGHKDVVYHGAFSPDGKTLA